jgi:hypothetical protein
MDDAAEENALKNNRSADKLVIEPEAAKIISNPSDTSSYTRPLKKKPQEHFSDMQVSELTQARLWTSMVLVWMLVFSAARLIIFGVTNSENTPTDLVLFAA